MAGIEQAVRAMLTANISSGVSDPQITHAYRLQDSPLPAITFEIESTTRAALSSLNQSTVRITAIAEQTLDAADLEPTIRAALVSGTYASLSLRVWVVESTVLSPPISGLSDEQEPASFTLSATVFWE